MLRHSASLDARRSPEGPKLSCGNGDNVGDRFPSREGMDLSSAGEEEDQQPPQSMPFAVGNLFREFVPFCLSGLS